MTVLPRLPLILLIAYVASAPLLAQPAAESRAAQALAPERFVQLAYSSAVLQAKAAALVASRETRPEARAFAQRMNEFRREHISKLEKAAQDNGVTRPTAQEFEHQIVLQNLEPLDFLALSRRYADVQVQALEQEVKGFTRAEGSSQGWLAALARETRPQLEVLLRDAQDMRRAVGP